MKIDSLMKEHCVMSIVRQREQWIYHSRGTIIWKAEKKSKQKNMFCYIKTLLPHVTLFKIIILEKY